MVYLIKRGKKFSLKFVNEQNLNGLVINSYYLRKINFDLYKKVLHEFKKDKPFFVPLFVSYTLFDKYRKCPIYHFYFDDLLLFIEHLQKPQTPEERP